MQALTIAMFVVVTMCEFFAQGDHWGRWAFLPRFAQYLPELFGLAAIIIVILLGTRNRFQFVRPQYWIVCGALVVTIICGILVNGVDSGPIFAGNPHLPACHPVVPGAGGLRIFERAGGGSTAGVAGNCAPASTILRYNSA